MPSRTVLITVVLLLCSFLSLIQADAGVQAKTFRRRCQQRRSTPTQKSRSSSASSTATAASAANPTMSAVASPSASSSSNASSSNFWSFPNWNGQSLTGWQQTWKVISDAYGKQNRALVPNPTDSSETVMRITYPKDSYVPSQSIIGGTGWYATPLNIPAGSPTVTFEYEVFFPTGFDFVKGGKLPGLYGGHKDCSGGNPATDCFSTRMMWRAQGAGELYAYVPKSPQAPTMCTTKGNVCDPAYGNSIGRGSFCFKAGQWNTVRQTIKPNPIPSQLTGSVDITVNGQTAISLSNIDYRIKNNVNVIGIDFETFFGGSDTSFQTPTTQYSYFRGFTLSYQ